MPLHLFSPLEDLADRIRIAVAIQIGMQVARVRMAGQPFGERIAVVVGERVQLGAVAGGQQRHFAHGRHRAQPGERVRQRVAAERDAFAQPDGCGLVIDAEDDEAHGLAGLMRAFGRLR